MAVWLIALLLHVCSISTSAALEDQTCRSSSCGVVPNISNPFRLKGDPSGCGDPNYELVCENNQTILNIYGGKFYVTEINYKNYSIRIVDPGLDKGDCFSSPLYYLTRSNFSYEDPYDWPNDWKPSSTVLRKCSCTIGMTIFTQPFKEVSSMSELQEELLAGVEISFLQYRCSNECNKENHSCYKNYDKTTINCVSHEGCQNWVRCLKPK